jgi:hypothetical protein
MTRKLIEHRTIAAAAALLMLMVGIAMVAHMSDGEPTESVHDLSAGQRSVNGDWQADLMQLASSEETPWPQTWWPFSHLRQPARGMPRKLRTRAVSNLGGHQDLGLRFDGAQFAHTTAGGGVWVVRGNRLTCIFLNLNAASSCGPDFYVFKHGLGAVVGLDPVTTAGALPRHFLAFGLVPNGIETVGLRVLGDPTMRVRVVYNVYSIQAKRPIYVQRIP